MMWGGHGGPRGHGGGHHGRRGHGGGGEHPFRFRRRYRSKEERIARLEQYLQALEEEAKGVRERLEELRGNSEKAE